MVAAIRKIVATEHVPGTTATLTIKGEFLPLEQTDANARRFAIYQKAASDTGLTVKGEFSGGCADSGFTSAVGTPTLCSTGPVGGGAHSPEEYLDVASIVPRAQALARAVVATGPIKA
jgi:glutamate carboxypeptidase